MKWMCLFPPSWSGWSVLCRHFPASLKERIWHRLQHTRIIEVGSRLKLSHFLVPALCFFFFFVMQDYSLFRNIKWEIEGGGVCLMITWTIIPKNRRNHRFRFYLDDIGQWQRSFHFCYVNYEVLNMFSLLSNIKFGVREWYVCIITLYLF